MNITSTSGNSPGSYLNFPDQQFKIEKIHREYPPVSFFDTATSINGEMKSIHGKLKFFKDHEIITIHSGVLITPKTDVKTFVDFAVKINDLGKHVLQQQATRGCTAGVVAMFLLDHERPINICELQDTNLGNNETMLRSLQDKDLNPIVHQIPQPLKNPLLWLKSKIDANGSAIVSIDDGGHVIIVDQVTDHGVRLRDPYHGWDITVTREAYLKNWGLLDKQQCLKGSIIQIKTETTI